MPYFGLKLFAMNLYLYHMIFMCWKAVAEHGEQPESITVILKFEPVVDEAMPRKFANSD